MLRLLLWPKKRGQTLRNTSVSKPNRADLEFLSELADSGRLNPVIDREYPLHEAAAAIAYLETGHARGKVVISMDSGQRSWIFTAPVIILRRPAGALICSARGQEQTSAAGASPAIPNGRAAIRSPPDVSSVRRNPVTGSAASGSGR